MKKILMMFGLVFLVACSEDVVYDCSGLNDQQQSKMSETYKACSKRMSNLNGIKLCKINATELFCKPLMKEDVDLAETTKTDISSLSDKTLTTEQKRALIQNMSKSERTDFFSKTADEKRQYFNSYEGLERD